MPIQISPKQTKTDGKESLSITFDNGDLKALDTIEERWNFSDKESFFKYAMAIFLSTEDSQLWIKANGQPKPVTPVDDLLKTKDGKNNENK